MPQLVTLGKTHSPWKAVSRSRSWAAGAHSSGPQEIRRGLRLQCDSQAKGPPEGGNESQPLQQGPISGFPWPRPGLHLCLLPAARAPNVCLPRHKDLGQLYQGERIMWLLTLPPVVCVLLSVKPIPGWTQPCTEWKYVICHGLFIYSLFAVLEIEPGPLALSYSPSPFQFFFSYFSSF